MRPAALHSTLPFPSPAITSRRPPGWLFAATGLLGVAVLAMAVAETNLWLHYLIDGGEYVSLLGLVFIAGAAVVLFRQRCLMVSLPLVGPWLLFPLITQGDQIIDNLSINSMRVICHVLLAAIFATPVGVAVLAARYGLPGRASPRGVLLGLLPGLRHLADGRDREGTTLLAVTLLVLEIWVAVEYLGALMIATLIVMILGVLFWGAMSAPSDLAEASVRRTRSERAALILVLVGVVVSFGLYEGYKNRPGAYQGSPSFLMDPQQQGSGYAIGRIAVPTGPVVVPASSDVLRSAFTGYGHTLQRLLEGYHILDRNYTYDFHNELFLRYTPLIPGYRAAGLERVAEARTLRLDADTAARSSRALLPDDSPLAALLNEVSGYVAFNFERASRIESMSADFEKTKAGLQHAAHIYEGEGKVLGMVLADIMMKHRRTLESAEAAPVTSEFARDAQAIYEAYASRIVGF